MATEQDSTVVAVGVQLATAHARLELPAGAVPPGIALVLEEGPEGTPEGTPAPPDLPEEHVLLGCWRLGADGGVRHGAPTEPDAMAFAQPGYLEVDLAPLAKPSVPADHFQMRQFAPRHRVWTDAPATLQPGGARLRVAVCPTGWYALVANTAAARATPVEATIGPAGGGLDYARLHLDVPAGAVDEPIRLRVGPPPAPFAPCQGGLPFAFAITAERLGDGQALDILARPLTLTVRFGPADVGTLPVGGLALKRWEGASASWRRLATAVDVSAGALRVRTAQLGAFSTDSPDQQHPFDFGTNWLDLDAFTGAASLAMPFELPPGPADLKPDLKLTYNSQASHWAQRANLINEQNYGKGLQSASWVGEGFDIPIGYVQKTTDNQDKDHYSVSIFGQSFRLFQDTGGTWHTTDEQF